MYAVKNFDPQLKRIKNETGLQLPLRRIRRLSDAVMRSNTLDLASNHGDYNDPHKIYRGDLSHISINELTEQNSDTEMIYNAFKQYNSIS